VGGGRGKGKEKKKKEGGRETSPSTKQPHTRGADHLTNVPGGGEGGKKRGKWKEEAGGFHCNILFV